MKTQFLATICTALFTLTFNASASTAPEVNRGTTDALLQLAYTAVSEDSELAGASIQSLRDAGPAGLNALFDAHAEIIEAHTATLTDMSLSYEDADWQRIRTAFDAVGMQRDCYASRLFWFTDFEQARAKAQESGKPILSLRLLGNLNEEYSCANSRFFRTTLYANTAVSRFLRENFVLHWKSVRPVPRITVDFGDGRRLERTITGNSIHYVLDSHGRVIDALPGLYGATAFIEGLQRAKETARAVAQLEGADLASQLRSYHERCALEIERRWQRDLAAVGGAPSTPLTAVLVTVDKAPTATTASALTLSKVAVEAPLLRQTLPGTSSESSPQGAAISDSIWQAIAKLHAEDSRLDTSSTRLVLDKTLSAAEAARIAFSKRLVEDPMIRTIQNLQRSISEDTVRNEYLLHSQIHHWFMDEPVPPDLEELNARAYAELFLTPDSDPWLGLAPKGVFSALDHGGLVHPTTIATTH